MERYSEIKEKRPREIVLLRGSGCVYGQCVFCDYHLDKDRDEAANFALNREVLSRVTGRYGELEVINSGSVFELDEATMGLINALCKEKSIATLHFESHYIYANRIEKLRKFFDGISVKMKLGLETFDYGFRENVLKKGISDFSPEIISRHFDEANFLFGISGQTRLSMERDIELGLKFFERICINVMCENSTPVKPDKTVIDTFLKYIYPRIEGNERVDILLSNTDFGVG